jgi:uncharacterized protein YkwD
MRVRRVSTLAAALAVLVVPTSGQARARGSVAPMDSLQAALVGQVNAFRVAHGLGRLRLSAPLTAAAAGHSTQMARLGYFSHNSASGAPFSRRIVLYYPARGYRSWTAGENLLWASPDVGAARALKMWLASPPHRANLLDPDWRELGLSAVHSTSAPGVYENAPATIVTADFGARSR